MFEIVLSPAAGTFYAAAEKPLAKKLGRCFEQLEVDPRGAGNAKRLTGAWSGYWRYRVGDLRVIYRIDDRERRVIVFAIGHRREAYD